MSKQLAPISTGNTQKLYNFLATAFDSHNGSPLPYLTALSGTNVNVSPQIHYSLRSFAPNSLTVRRSMNDMSFWNVGHFQGLTMTQLQNETLTAWNEAWTLTSGSTATLNLSSAPQYRYSDLLSFSATGTNPSGTLVSSYNDDILTDFNDSGSTYYIEMLLRQFPDQTAPVHLNLTSSFIDFSSDSTGRFDTTQTDSIPFSASLTSISSTSNNDVLFRISRSSLTTANLSALKYIRFRLVGAGTGTLNFKAQCMRLYKNGSYSYPATEIDTKRKALGAALVSSGTTLGPDSGLLIFNPSKPKDIVQYVKFNTGHHAITASGVNELDLLYRYGQNSNASFSNTTVKLQLNTTTSGSIIIQETISGTTTTLLTSPNLKLPSGTDFFLKTELLENKIRVGIYNVNNVFVSSGTYISNQITLTDVPRRGYLAYQYKPYNYDFRIHYIRPSYVNFGRMETKASLSFTPVIGAVLNTTTSPPLNITSGKPFTVAGDAIVTELNNNNDPDITIARTGSTWYGAYTTSGTVFVGNPEYISISGRIFPSIGFSGLVRVALINQWGMVAFMEKIENLLNNQWNNFYIPVRVSNIPPEPYTLWIFDSSFTANTFELTDVQINHTTVSWDGTADGTNWQHFYDAINENWNGIQFQHIGTRLSTRAFAHSDQNESWIQSFSTTPIYYGFDSIKLD